MSTQPIYVQMQYNTSLHKVWDALTDAEKMKEWYFDIKNFKPEVGAIFEFYEPGGTKFLHRCKILEIIPFQKLKHTWTYPDYFQKESVVIWELSPISENKTKLSLTHESLESFEGEGEAFAKKNFEEGWNSILGKSLKTFLEK